MFGLGIWELVLILLMVVIIFGVGRLPELGGALGKSIKAFKKATKEPDEIDVTPKKTGEDETGNSTPGSTS
ncbi:MAG: twin-arginine translocase TatA/TatE family subunit [Deltaproteobacteria bacterium]|nr:twin-arginine translocase TatA/TatE family subunit [Deltaproteobacteria bacterium]